MRFAPDWLAWVPLVWGDYWVIQLDANYEVSLVGTPDRRHLWLLSRHRHLPDARLRALLRRRTRLGEAATPVVTFGAVEVDLSRRLVTRDGEPVHLTPLEYRLLTALLAQPGKVLTQRHLLRDIWGPTYVDSSHYLRVYVGHLRQKLEDDPAQPKHLLTETGVGYRFHP